MALWMTAIYMVAFSTGMHAATIIGHLAVMTMGASLNHAGFDLEIRFLGVDWYSTGAHEMHHRRPDKNFAQFTMFWDKLMGTYIPCRSPQALNEADDKFRDYAKVIARDVARVYTGHEQVDQLRLEMAAVLRGYARKNPHLGYTQGMCFLAAVTCSKGVPAAGEVIGLVYHLESRSENPCVPPAEESQSGRERVTQSDQGRDSLIAEQLFADYMASFKLLWSQDFPLIDEGIPLLQSVLDKTDGQLSYHLFQTLGQMFAS
eukprot:g20748.t1